jgi:hypothetical protein
LPGFAPYPLIYFLLLRVGGAGNKSDHCVAVGLHCSFVAATIEVVGFDQFLKLIYEPNASTIGDYSSFQSTLE